MLFQRMDRRPRLRLHLHPPHRSRNRPLVRPRSPPVDIPRTADLQIDFLDPVLRHRHRNHSRATRHRLQSDLANLEILASGWHVCFSRDHNCGAHLRLGGCSQVPQVWNHCGHVVGEQDVPQGRGIGSERAALLVVILRYVPRRQGVRCRRARTYFLPNENTNFYDLHTRYFVLVILYHDFLARFAQTVVVLSQTETMLVVSQPNRLVRSAAFRLDLFYPAKVLQHVDLDSVAFRESQ